MHAFISIKLTLLFRISLILKQVVGLLLFVVTLQLGASAKMSDLDSLLLCVKSTHLHDSNHVKNLIKLSEKLFVHDLSLSGKYAQEALEIAQNESFLSGIANAERCIGKYYWQRGDRENGLKYGFSALKKLEEMQDFSGVAATCKYLAFIYLDEGKLQEAKDFFFKALDISLKTKDKKREKIAYLDIAAMYQQLNPDSARVYYEKSMRLDAELGNSEEMAWTNYSLGVFLINQKQYGEAKTNLEKAVTIFEQKQNKIALSACFTSFGYLYRIQKEYGLSQIFLEKSLNILAESGSLSQLSECYEQLYMMYKQKGDAEKALLYHEKLFTVKDSLNNQAKNGQVVEMQTRYETEKRVKENELLTARQQKQRLFIFAIATGLLLTSILVIVLFQYNRSHLKVNQTLMKLNGEINMQKEKITEQSFALKQVNLHLEEIVEDRTQELKVQNEKLLNFASHNSHKVRGPLARILGIVYALEEKYITDYEFAIKNIGIASHEMDLVITEINEILLTEEEREQTGKKRKEEENG
jgi:tetratricopeptide (TPR) repeat protein